jgi:hypothetical protein
MIMNGKSGGMWQEVQGEKQTETPYKRGSDFASGREVTVARPTVK